MERMRVRTRARYVQYLAFLTILTTLVRVGLAERFAQADAAKCRPAPLPGAFEASFPQHLRERLFAARRQAAPFAPRAPVQVQRVDRREGDRRRDGAPLLEPLAEHVLGVEILLARPLHRSRRVETPLLPLEATVDRPAQDRRPLGPQLLGQVLVPLRLRDVLEEGHQL